MRTKTVVLSALMGLAGAASVMAQTVYSLNTVGYINVTCPPGFSMIANQLDSGTNTIYNLLSTAAPGDLFYKFKPSTGYKIFTFDEFDLAWTPAADADATLNPGEGGFFYNGAPTNKVFTFVGNVVQGTTTNTLAAGYNIASSVVPQGGKLTDFGFPGVPGDLVYKFSNASGYQIFTFDEFDLIWTPAPGPTVNVGESFFVYEAGATQWVRSFTVN